MYSMQIRGQKLTRRKSQIPSPSGPTIDIFQIEIRISKEPPRRLGIDNGQVSIQDTPPAGVDRVGGFGGIWGEI